MALSVSGRMLRRLTVLLILAVLAGGYAYWARPWEAKPTPVDIEVLTQGPASEVLAVNGQIVPNRTVDLSASVSARIATLKVSEGDAVKKGQVLARLDDTAARAGLDQAEAALNAANISLTEAKLANQRTQALGATVSQQSRDSARFAYQAATASQAQAQAAYQKAEQNVKDYTIRAPFDGTVLSIDAEPGQIASTSTTLFTIGNLSPPLVQTDVDEVYGARMKVGLDARVAPVGSTQSSDAKVSFVAPTVDTATGGRTIKLSFDNAPTRLLPSGLTMSVNIVVDRFENAISIPRDAILDLSGTPYVFVDHNGEAQKQDIAVRDWPASRLIVTKGLHPGDKLITNPEGLAGGEPVTPDTAPKG